MNACASVCMRVCTALPLLQFLSSCLYLLTPALWSVHYWLVTDITLVVYASMCDIICWSSTFN